MIERKLTAEEIEHLFTFVDQRDVKYYDVQMELVDHFASAIEQRWETECGLSFDEALRTEYKQFNKYDFSQILEEKEETIRKKYSGLQRRYIRDYFKLPKIVMTLAMTFVLFTSFMYSNNFFKAIALLLVSYLLFILIYGLVLFPWKYKLKIVPDKTFLLYDQYKQAKARMFLGANLVNIFVIAMNQIGKQQILTYPHLTVAKLLIAFVFTLIGIFTIVTAIYIPRRFKADFTREFPQFVKS